MGTIIPGILSVFSGSLTAVAVYLAFVFPKTVAAWQQAGKSLSVVEVTLASVSHLCSQFGIIIIPILGLCFVASIVWMVVGLVKATSDSA